MDNFYFTLGYDPRDVFIVIGDNWVLYMRCENEKIAKAIVECRNKSRGDGNGN